jgi:uncharacterized protein YneF (UPF0154 family)
LSDDYLTMSPWTFMIWLSVFLLIGAVVGHFVWR